MDDNPQLTSPLPEERRGETIQPCATKPARVHLSLPLQVACCPCGADHLIGSLEIKLLTLQPTCLCVNGHNSLGKTRWRTLMFRESFFFIMKKKTYGICLQCVKLPVGGGAGVEDVLFGREQRQAVGIKVDRSRVHAGKSFQTTQLLSSLLPTVFGVGVSAGGEKKKRKRKTATAEHRGLFTAEKTAARVCRFMQCGFKFRTGAICAGAAHSQRGGDCDCTLVFVQRSRLSFH